MTKPGTDFVEDDRAMARRAAWLLHGHPPGRESPPLDLDLGVIYKAVGEDGFLKPLARFAIIRELDVTRAIGPRTGPATQQEAEALLRPEVAEFKHRVRMQAEANVDEKRANELLREGKLRLDNAAKHWLAASQKRADDWGKIPVATQTGEHQAVLAEVLAAAEAVDGALALMDSAMRRVAGEGTRDPFQSALGLPRADRNASLGAQALALFEVGYSLEEIAYVMDWYGGSPAEIRDRTRKRLEVARARLGGSSSGG